MRASFSPDYKGSGVLSSLSQNTEWLRSLLAGLAHPVLGLDHLFALLGVGMWAARLGDTARRAVPAAFLVGMPMGFLLVVQQPPSPLIDSLVKLLAIASGPLIAATLILPVRLPLREALYTLALMGGCHGYVHGVELGNAEPWAFTLGFLISAIALLTAGLTVGLSLTRDR